MERLRTVLVWLIVVGLVAGCSAGLDIPVACCAPWLFVESPITAAGALPAATPVQPSVPPSFPASSLRAPPAIRAL